MSTNVAVQLHAHVAVGLLVEAPPQHKVTVSPVTVAEMTK
jgi:hypothetical protein